MTQSEENHNSLKQTLDAFERTSSIQWADQRKTPMADLVPTGEEYRKLKEQTDNWEKLGRT